MEIKSSNENFSDSGLKNFALNISKLPSLENIKLNFGYN